MLYVFAATTVNGVVEVADPLNANTWMFPVVAVDGTTNVTLVGVDAVTGAGVVPPPCRGTSTVTGVPWLDTRVVPVIVTDVPIGPVGGVKLVIVGAGSPEPTVNTFGAVAASKTPADNCV